MLSVSLPMHMRRAAQPHPNRVTAHSQPRQYLCDPIQALFWVPLIYNHLLISYLTSGHFSPPKSSESKPDPLSNSAARVLDLIPPQTVHHQYIVDI